MLIIFPILSNECWSALRHSVLAFQFCLILQEVNKNELERFNSGRRRDFMEMLKGFIHNQVCNYSFYMTFVYLFEEDRYFIRIFSNEEKTTEPITQK